MGSPTTKFEIEHIEKLSLKKSDFEGCDEDCVAALAVLSQAVSEVNVLLRLYLFLDHEFQGPDELDIINHFQRNVVLRIFSAKIFEASEFVQLKGNRNKTNSNTLIGILDRFGKSFRWLRKHQGYELVRSLRHEATNHYCLDPAKKNLGFVPDTADFSFLLHKMDGNCLFLAGETVMHYGRVQRHSDGRGSKGDENLRSEYELWLHWNLAALRWLKRVHSAIVDELILEKMPGKRSDRRVLWLPQNASAKPQDRLTPFFVRRS